MKRLAILALLLSGTAFGQGQPWDTNIISWTAPTTNTDGTALTNLSGYRIERGASATGSFASIGTSTVTTYTHTGAAAGQNCYRVIAMASNGQESIPSNVACKTNTRPATIPNPPTNLRFTDAVAFDLRREGSRWYLSRHVATVKPSAVPVSRYTVANGTGYCQVRRADTVQIKASSGVLVAKCA